jgi:hypothetical protein
MRARECATWADEHEQLGDTPAYIIDSARFLASFNTRLAQSRRKKKR